jgi:uncharacterized protein with gpF-like domain
MLKNKKHKGKIGMENLKEKIKETKKRIANHKIDNVEKLNQFIKENVDMTNEEKIFLDNLLIKVKKCIKEKYLYPPS